MYSPEDQQISICLLKSDLEKIGDDLVVHNSALPALDAESEQKYHETMVAVRIARSLNIERERLNQENVRLTAKRMQLKRECEDMTSLVEKARDHRNKLENLLKCEEQEMELQIRKYEDSLREKADRFRKTRSYYNEEETKSEIQHINKTVAQLEDEMKRCQYAVEELKRHHDDLKPDVPVNLLEILGKPKLDERLKKVLDKHQALCEQRSNLGNLDNNKIPI